MGLLNKHTSLKDCICSHWATFLYAFLAYMDWCIRLNHQMILKNFTIAAKLELVVNLTTFAVLLSSASVHVIPENKVKFTPP